MVLWKAIAGAHHLNEIKFEGLSVNKGGAEVFVVHWH